MTNTLKPSVNIVAPKGYSVAVTHGFEHTSVRTYDRGRTCNRVDLLGDVEAVFPADDGKSMCVIVAQGPRRYLATFDTDPGFDAPTPYIPVRTK